MGVVYKISEIDKFLNSVYSFDIIYNKKIRYINLPCAFDIETSSYYINNGVQYSNDEIKKKDRKFIDSSIKVSTMYIWQFAINDNVIIGRTWKELEYLFNKLDNKFDLQKNKLIIYVHNLSYEFQFMRKHFIISNVFADEKRQIIKCEINNIIFKCSYRLTGKSLEAVSNELQNKIVKLVGFLDYSKIRHYKTELTNSELHYCVNDVLIITQYIKETIEFYNNDISQIPLTATGKIRRLARSMCFQNKNYKNFIHGLTLEKNEYLLLKKAYSGGFTHSNAMYNDITLENVTSLDFNSSYPTVMIAEKYPMSKGRQIKITSIEQIKFLSRKYCLLLDVQIIGLRPRYIYDNIISLSKCRKIENYLVNNGRVVSAKSLIITLTEVDFLNVLNFYKFDSIRFGLCYIYEKNYLPHELLECVLLLYKNKTMLKNVKGKEIEYISNKELLNSLYGMCVTEIVRNVIEYKNNVWYETETDIQQELNKYNSDKTRFLFYPWGVWITAYSRRNLFLSLLECRRDYIYSDTDSVKILNYSKHKHFFDYYNNQIYLRLLESCKYNNFSIDDIQPKTIEGVKKILGVFEIDGIYKKFKTLGAKRYIYLTNENKFNITVAGLSKKKGANYLTEKSKEMNIDVFDLFTDLLYIDSENTGKNTHTYIDNEIECICTDYKNESVLIHELSYIHLEACEYSLNMISSYIDYCNNIKSVYK